MVHTNLTGLRVGSVIFGNFDGRHGAQGDPATGGMAHETPVVDRAAVAPRPEPGRRHAHPFPAERLDPRVEHAYRNRRAR